MTSTLHLGDCLEVLRTMADNSVDAVVTDPPYGLSFMGKKWDYDVPSVAIWAECLRVLKPGGHLLAFAGTRTQHRMAVRIEDAGFEIRDMIAWVYGSGFPKSLDVSKAIDKAAGAEGGRGPMKRGGERLARLENGKRDGEGRWGDESGRDPYTYAPATPEAQQWAGWGTALKPALEPITMARKPLAGTVAANVLEHGTGGINVDGCRIGGPIAYASGGFPERTNSPEREGREEAGDRAWARSGEGVEHREVSGRWPANLIHDGSDEVVELFPTVASGMPGVRRKPHATCAMSGRLEITGDTETGYADSGSAARFFYTAKASRDDRDPGNTHPTVKPTELMRYLCRLVTPPGGIVLDPFMGSGSTGKAAMLEGFGFIGIEREAPSYAIAQHRISRAQAAGHQPDLFASVGPVA
jgi:site-specific DNA-methyltransferase (adenine-specific)